MHPGKRFRGIGVRSIERGFTFIAVLVLLALCGLALAAVGPAWSARSQRDREEDLLRVGALYARAIAEYRDMSPGTAKVYPDSLDSLVLDTRLVGVTRHLRKLYPDPMNPGRPWGLLKDEAEHIVGVYSLSAQKPFRQQALTRGPLKLAAAQHYSDWKFRPRELITATAASVPGNTSRQIQ